jgi:uncharacterized membrane protein YcgQ (UPF0703/DUF1980 family)
MKRKLAIVLLVCSLTLTGCQNQAAVASSPAAQLETPALKMPVVEISEKMFIAQCNDVYLNPDDYQGKAIKLEGIYSSYVDSKSGNAYHYVMRYGPGCCGNDGSAGFEFLYDGEMPKPDDWIEVTGTVEKVTEDDMEYIVLRASKVTVLDVRGVEFVSN